MINIPEYLSERYSPWVWMGQRAHDAEGINRILPMDMIISCNYGREVPVFFKQENVFSVERINGIRKNWSNEDLAYSLEGPLGKEIFEKWKGYEKPVNILCYRSLKQIETRTLGIKRSPLLFSVPESTKHFFDNKILLQKNLARLGLPAIDGMVAYPVKMGFNSLRREFGMPFVVQFPYGSSGSSTYIIRSESEYRSACLKAPFEQAVIRKYMNGFSMNINAVIVSDGSGPRTLSSYPSVQITGAPECSNFRSAYCGNDYTVSGSVSERVINEIARQTRIIGRWMGILGYRGLFGMDYIVRKEKVYPVEINPRFQNSTSLHTTASIAGKYPGKLFLLHIAEFLQKEDNVMRDYVKTFDEKNLMEPLTGAQIILHNGPGENYVAGSVGPGIYRMVLGKLAFFCETASLADCVLPEDVLLTCGVPERSTRVEPGAPLCKLQFLTNAVDIEDKKRLTPSARSIIRSVYSAFKLKDVSGIEVMAP